VQPPQPPNVLPPRERRWPWRAIAISVVVHALLVTVKIGPWIPPPRLPEHRVVLVPLGTEGARAVDMPFRTELSSGNTQRRPPRSGVLTIPQDETGPVPEPTKPDTGTLTVREPVPDTGSGPVGKGPGRGRIGGPALGEGKLWVRPLPLPPQELAQALIRSHAQLVDSAVTVIVQGYIDSVLNAEPENMPLPSWTTKVGDKQIGLDSRWIYIGPIKIPTALLAAFLPINGGASATDYERFRALRQMREDVQVAARRAATMQDFKRAIRELRAERDREREFTKNQKTPPAKKDSTVVKVP
jgi:hypothetical protein